MASAVTGIISADAGNKVVDERGMSSRRSRSGAQLYINDVQPEEQIAPERPFSTSLARSRLVAAMIRKSERRVVIAPTAGTPFPARP